MKKVFIYSLLDPDTKTIRYIGKTNNIQRRYNTHLSNARNFRDGNRVGNWIRKLLRENKKPIIEIILKVEENKWQEAEIFYIKKYRKIVDLTNLCDGGKGGINNKGNSGNQLSEEWKKKISVAHIGKKHTIKSREKIRRAKLGTKASDETKKKMSETRKGQKKPKSYSEKLSKRMLVDNPAKRKDVREKISRKKRERDLIKKNEYLQN